MMKSILVVASLVPDKDVSKESTEVFTELTNVENMHCFSCFWNFRTMSVKVHSISTTPKPSWHSRGSYKNPIC